MSRFFWKLLVSVWLLACLGPKSWVLFVRFWNRVCKRTFWRSFRGDIRVWMGYWFQGYLGKSSGHLDSIRYIQILSLQFFNYAFFKLALLGKTCIFAISILKHEYFYTYKLISLKPIVYRARRIECAIKIYCLHKIEPLFPLWKRKAALTKINFFPSPCLAKCFL